MEVLISVVIIGLGALGLSAMFAGAAGQQRRASVVNQSVQLAQNAQAMVLRSFGRMEGGKSTSCQPNCDEWRTAVADEDEHFLTTADRSYFVVGPVTTDLFSQTLMQFTSGGVQAPTALPSLPHARIHRDATGNSGVTITVTVEETTSGFGNNPATVDYTYEERPPMTQGEPPSVTAVCISCPLGRGGSFTVDRAETSSGGANVATITPFGLFDVVLLFKTQTGATDGFVSNIEVEYEWRNDNLVSLGDRFLFEEDDRMPGGRRPVLGYTLLTRTTGQTSQLAIFTYSLEPLAVPDVNLEDEPLFIPPETEAEVSADRGLLREAEVELGWEEATGKFFLTPVSAQDEWVIEPGQLVLVKKLNQAVGGLTAGADGGVRIVAVRRVRTGGGSIELRGILDGSPRILGRSPLRNLNQRVELTVFAFPAVVKSLTSDETEWAIRPIETRVVQALAP